MTHHYYLCADTQGTVRVRCNRNSCYSSSSSTGIQHTNNKRKNVTRTLMRCSINLKIGNNALPSVSPLLSLVICLSRSRALALPFQCMLTTVHAISIFDWYCYYYFALYMEGSIRLTSLRAALTRHSSKLHGTRSGPTASLLNGTLPTGLCLAGSQPRGS